uniref:Uncharacterized protein n=1 Tax=Anguilla anguilla TaxID=7936 RepID=A0A0E9QWY6_ANGAN
MRPSFASLLLNCIELYSELVFQDEVRPCSTN